MKDDHEHWWAYSAVKAAVLAVVAVCLVGANTLGGGNSTIVVCDYASAVPRPSYSFHQPCFSFGWPFEYVWFEVPWRRDPSPCLFAPETFDQLNHPPFNSREIPSIDVGALSVDIFIAVGLLFYLAHVITVVHRRWRLIYQFSLRFLLALPVLLAGIMALIHYDLLTWRRSFLAVAYAAVVVSAVFLVGEVCVFLKTRRVRISRDESMS